MFDWLLTIHVSRLTIHASRLTFHVSRKNIVDNQPLTSLPPALSNAKSLNFKNLFTIFWKNSKNNYFAYPIHISNKKIAI